MTSACYRNTAIELEPGRFSRDEWKFELARIPDRKELGTASQPRLVVVSKPTAKKQPHGRPRMYTFADCAPTSGLYSIVSHDLQHRSGRVLLIRCSGPVCGGHERRVTYAEWQTAAKACHRCAHASRFDQATVPPTSGLYVLERVYRSEESSVIIEARCTGPGCGGEHRMKIRVDRWMRGLKHCQTCANYARRKLNTPQHGECQ